jgi:hypothetical protein
MRLWGRRFWGIPLRGHHTKLVSSRRGHLGARGTLRVIPIVSLVKLFSEKKKEMKEKKENKRRDKKSISLEIKKQHEQWSLESNFVVKRILKLDGQSIDQKSAFVSIAVVFV